jgi:DNA-binding IclR family transcriptional regulator
MPAGARNGNGTTGTQTVLRASAVLDCFSEDDPEWSITDLARKLHLNQSTVSRLVGTLEATGLLERVPGALRVRVGLRAAVLGYVALSQMELRRASLPVLEMLSRDTGLNATLAVLSGTQAIYVARVEVDQLFHGEYVLGRVAPLHGSAVGKLLLAEVAPATAQRLLAKLPLKPYTPNTLTTADALRRELKTIRTRRYGTDRSEWLAGVGAIAFPVRDAGGVTVAAVAVSGLMESVFTSGSVVMDKVRTAAERLSYMNGYSRAYA